MRAADVSSKEAQPSPLLSAGADVAAEGLNWQSSPIRRAAPCSQVFPLTAGGMEVLQHSPGKQKGSRWWRQPRAPSSSAAAPAVFPISA